MIKNFFGVINQQKRHTFVVKMFFATKNLINSFPRCVDFASMQILNCACFFYEYYEYDDDGKDTLIATNHDYDT